MKNERYFQIDEIIKQMNRPFFSIILRLMDNHLWKKWTIHHPSSSSEK